jgi:8-oxo-dGTP pyrophosphatase MutT (NUDIX family)/ribosomal protein L40E
MSWEDELQEAVSFTKGMSNHYRRLVKDTAYHTCEECGFAVGKYPGRYGKVCIHCGANFHFQHTFPNRPKVMDSTGESIMGDPARAPQTTQGMPAMPAIGEDEDEEVTESESLPQPELVEIIDTREFDWETGKPISGTGKPNFCGRCSKAHEVHWVVRDAHGKTWTVGASCAKLVWDGWQPAPEHVKRLEQAAEEAMRTREAGKRDAIVKGKVDKAEAELISTFPGYTTETVDARGKIYLSRDNKTFVTRSDLALAAKPKDAVRILIKKWVKIRAVELLRAVRPKLTKEEIDAAVKRFADSVVPMLVGKTAVTEKLTPVAADKCDPLELEAGIATEMEHTDSREEASVIARQHLSEDPHYYRKLFQAKILKRDEVGDKVWDKMKDTWTESFLTRADLSRAAESGKAVCAWCGMDLGHRPALSAGDVTHGICQACLDKMLSGRGKPTKTETAIREMLGGTGGAASSTTEPAPGDTLTPSGPHSANTQQKEMASVDSQSTTTPVAPTGNFQGSGSLESVDEAKATCANCGASVPSTDMRGSVCRKCASEMVRPDNIPTSKQKTEAAASPKLISIEDTRDLDFDTGRRIPGSGIFKDCARCTRPHQIYYSVQDKDGKVWSVGSGCCKQFFAGWEPTEDEVRVARQKAREQKNSALKAKEDTLKAEWTAEIRKQVASIQRPRVSPVGPSKWGHTPQDFDYSTSDGVLTSMVAKSKGESFESLSLDMRSSFWTEWAGEVVSSVWDRMGYGKMIPKSFDVTTLRHKVLSPVTQELLRKLHLSESCIVEFMLKLPADVDWYSPDGGYSKIWLRSACGVVFFWLRNDRWGRQDFGPQEEVPGQQISASHPKVRAIRAKFFSLDESSWISEFVDEVMETYCEGVAVHDTVPGEDGGTAFTAACSIIIRDKSEILLGLAVTADDRNGQWCFPGGGVDPEDGGDVLAAARREAYEETGCDVRPTGTVIVHPDKPEVAFVVTEYVSGSCEPNKEFAELQWVPFGAIDQFPDIYPINKQVLQRVPSGQLGS